MATVLNWKRPDGTSSALLVVGHPKEVQLALIEKLGRSGDHRLRLEGRDGGMLVDDEVTEIQVIATDPAGLRFVFRATEHGWSCTDIHNGGFTWELAADPPGAVEIGL